MTTEETTTGSTTATVDEYAGFAGVRYSLRKQVIADLQKAQKQYHVGNADTFKPYAERCYCACIKPMA